MQLNNVMDCCDGVPISNLTESLIFSGSELFAFVQDGATRSAPVSSFVSYLSTGFLTYPELYNTSYNWDNTRQVVITDGGRDRWDSNYATTGCGPSSSPSCPLSARWAGVYNTVNVSQDEWNKDTHITSEFQAASGEWEDNKTGVQLNSAVWNEAFNSALFKQTSANWSSTYTTVNDLSSGWGETTDQLSFLQQLSSTWQNTYTTTTNNSANWESAYGSVSCQSWNNEFITIGSTNTYLDIDTGVAVRFRAPYNIDLLEVRASVNSAPIGGDIIVDIKSSGLSILNAPLVIDAGSRTSIGSAQTPIINTRGALLDNEEITIEVQQVGSTQPGKGLKVTLIGSREGCYGDIITPPTPNKELRAVKEILTNTGPYIANDILQYQVTVTNVGGELVSNISFNDTLPDITYVSGSVPLSTGTLQLDTDESASLIYSYTVKQLDVDNWINNLVPLSNTTTIESSIPQVSSNTVVVNEFTATGLLDITKEWLPNQGSGSGLNGFIPGDELNFRVVITNPNAIPVAGALLSDTAGPTSNGYDHGSITAINDPLNITNTPITLAPYETITVLYAYTISQNDVDNYLDNNIPLLTTAVVIYTGGESYSNTITFTNFDAPFSIPSDGVGYIERYPRSVLHSPTTPKDISMWVERGGTNFGNTPGITYVDSNPAISGTFIPIDNFTYTPVTLSANNFIEKTWFWQSSSINSGSVGGLTRLELNNWAFGGYPYLDEVEVLNVSQLKYLQVLSLQGNSFAPNGNRNIPGKLTIDVSSNNDLQYLNLQNYQIAGGAIDLSQNPLLKQLYVVNGGLTAVDVTQNPNIWMINVPRNRTYPLALDEPGLSSIDVSQNLNLTTLICNDNRLSSIDVTQNPNLLTLYCENNFLTSIDVTQNPKLGSLIINGPGSLLSRVTPKSHAISAIDLTQNTSLQLFRADNTQLSSINLTQNVKLTTLSLNNTPISAIDLTQNSKLNNLRIFNDPDINALPTRSDLHTLALTAHSELQIIAVEQHDNLSAVYLGSASFPITGDSFGVCYLDLGYNPSLSALDFSYLRNGPWSIDVESNSMSILDLSNVNTASVDANNNQLVTFTLNSDVAVRQACDSIVLSDNLLTSIDISNINGVNCTSLFFERNLIDTINATNWSGAQSPCRWENNRLSTDAVWDTLNQANTANPPTVIRIFNNPCVSPGGILLDGLIHTAADTIALAASKNYTLQLSP